jgi:hypothetical protein
MGARNTLTVVSGTTITSAWGNGVRDHIVSYASTNDVSITGQTSFNTSTGRLVYWNGSAAVPIAGDMPRCRVTQSAPGAPVGPGVLQTLSWNTVEYNTANMRNGLIPSVIVAPFTGMYLCAFKVTFASRAGGARSVWMQTSVRHAEDTEILDDAGPASGSVHSGAAEVFMTAAATISVVAFHNTATPLDVQTSADDYFTARFLGPTT